MVKNILAFYGTIGVPLLYLFILHIIFNTRNTLIVSSSVHYWGLGVGVVGLIVWILSYIYLGKAFGVLPKKQKIVSRGVYKFFKHPMYIGISMTFVGLSIAMGSLPGLVLTLIILVPLLIVRATFEEKKLEK